MAIAEMSTETNTHDDVHERLEALEQQVVLVAPSLGIWQGRYQIADAKVSVQGGHEVDAKAVTRPQLKILELSARGRAYRAQFQAISTAKSRCVEKYSVPFPIDGVRIIPRAKISEFFNELVGPTIGGLPVEDPERDVQSVAYRLAKVADDFAADYPQIIEEARLNTDNVIWQRVAGRLPRQNAVRRKFYLTTSAIRLASGENARLTNDEMLEMSDFMRSSLQAQVEAAVEAMVSGPREQLAEAIADLQKLIADGGRVTSKSFNPIKTAVEKIRTFAFLAPAELLGQIAALESRMGGVTPSELDQNTAVSSGLSDLMQDVQRAVSDARDRSDIVRRFGRNARAFDLD